MAEAYLPAPREKLNVPYVPYMVNGDGWQIPRYSTIFGSYTSVTKSQVVAGSTRMGWASSGSAPAVGVNVNVEVKRRMLQPFMRKGGRLKQDTSSFGPVHTEHIRHFYQSNESGLAFDFNSQLILPCQNAQFVGQKPVYYQACNSIPIERGRYLRTQRYRKKWSQNREHESVKSVTRTPILKMAMISPRPGNQNEKANNSCEVEIPKYTSKEIEKRKLLSSKIERELSCSPIFQILGELPRARQ